MTDLGMENGLIRFGGFWFSSLVELDGAASTESMEIARPSADLPVFTLAPVASSDGASVWIVLSDGRTRKWERFSIRKEDSPEPDPWFPPVQPDPPNPEPPGPTIPIYEGPDLIAATADEFRAADQAAKPGDVVWITEEIGDLLEWWTPGEPGNPIRIYCRDSGKLTGTAPNPSTKPMLDVRARHVEVNLVADGKDAPENLLGVVRYLNGGGSAGSPVEAWIDAVNMPRHGIAIQADKEGRPSSYVNVHVKRWVSDIHGKANPQWGEPVYIGQASPNEWATGAEDIRVWVHDADGVTAEVVEIKPGCNRVTVHEVNARNVLLSTTHETALPTGAVVVGWANSEPPEGHPHRSIGAGHRVESVNIETYQHADGGLGPDKAWKYPPVLVGVGGVEVVGPIVINGSDVDCDVRVGSPKWVGPPAEIAPDIENICTAWGGQYTVDGELGMTDVEIDASRTAVITFETDIGQAPVFGVNPWEIESVDQGASLTMGDIGRDWENSERFTTPTNRHHSGASPQEAMLSYRFAPAFVSRRDPIRHPGEAAPILNQFFGNLHVPVDATAESLIREGGSTSNGREVNRSAGWVPALLDRELSASGCNVITPASILVHHRSRHPETTIETPFGLHLLGGNIYGVPEGMRYGFEFEPQQRLRWGFYDPTLQSVVSPQSTIPSENPGGYQRIRLTIEFAQCVRVGEDGDLVLSSPDGSHLHMLYDHEGRFSLDTEYPPDGFVEIPKMVWSIDYLWPEDGDTSRWRLTSDLGASSEAFVTRPGGSAHGAMIWAWHPEVMRRWMLGCFWDESRRCPSGEMGFGQKLSPLLGTYAYDLQKDGPSILVPVR